MAVINAAIALVPITTKSGLGKCCNFETFFEIKAALLKSSGNKLLDDVTGIEIAIFALLYRGYLPPIRHLQK